MIKLSILVPTVPSRIVYYYPKIMKQLIAQTKQRGDVEVIALFDNKMRTIGQKRQEMVDISQGEYIIFIDDDDRITDDFVEEIMNALYKHPECDCVVYHAMYSANGQPAYICKFGIEYQNGIINKGEPNQSWAGKPTHTMVYKASIVKKHKFRHFNCGEDGDWTKRAYLDIKNQIKIDKVLYFYDANFKTTSETAGLPDDFIEQNINELIAQEHKLVVVLGVVIMLGFTLLLGIYFDTWTYPLF
jgi:hypothetical protein